MLGLTRHARGRHAGERRSRVSHRRRSETFLERRTSSVLLLAAPLLFGWAWIEVMLGVAAFYHPNSIRYDGGRSLSLALGAGVLALLLAATFASAGDRIASRWRARVVMGLAALVAGAHLVILITTPRVPDTYVRTFDGKTYAVPSTHTTTPGDVEGYVRLDICQHSGAGYYQRGHDCQRTVSVALRPGRPSGLDLRPLARDIGGRAASDSFVLPPSLRGGGTVGRWTIERDIGTAAADLLVASDGTTRHLMERDPDGRLIRVADCDARFDLCRVSREWGSGVIDYEFRGPIPTSPAPFDAFERRVETWLEGWRTS